jgi:PAS domain S-box-containing protein
MKAVRNLPLTDTDHPSNDGHSTGIIHPLPKNGAQDDGFPKNRLLLAVVLIVAIVFAWICWNLVHAPQRQPAVLELLAVYLLVSAAAVGAVFWGCQASSESAQLAKERDLLRTIIDNLPDYIYAKDKQGRFVLNNPAHAKDLGAVSPGAMNGKSDHDYFPRELAEQFLVDEQKVIATGQSVINQEQYRFHSGDKSGLKFWSLTSKVVWRDQNGEVLGTVGITRDIHEVKTVQEALRRSEQKLREFAAQLEHSNRELQDFAYVASHDLQEPLRKIIVFGERLKEKCGEMLGVEPRDYLERMQKAAARMQTLINELLTFSRVTSKTHPFAPVNLAEVVREVVDDLEGRIEQVKGRVEVVGELPVIDAEKLQMRQLLQNLIGNALKFRRPEAPPLVTVAARNFSDNLERKFCELSIGDNGIGFDEKYLDRIFNVFQRLHTRNEYEGTGMGLAIVRKIAMYHGGDITAKSQPGQGATFVVTLPLTHSKKAETHNEKDNHEN